MEEKTQAPPVRCFSAVGGDARLTAAAQRLRAAGLTQLPPGQEEQAQLLLLGVPTPTLEAGTPLPEALRPGTLLFAGAVSPAARQQAAQRGLRLIDYMDSEELAVTNAVPTAEAALAILIGATQKTLWRARAVVCGYGRIGAVLTLRLLAMGCRVTVVARRPEVRARAAALGSETADFPALEQLARETDYLINTVPQRVIGVAVLRALPPDAFVLDLAGAPGGVDWQAARQLRVQGTPATGLPGKWAAETAGQAVADHILRFLRENGLLPDGEGETA